jgi:integrase
MPHRRDFGTVHKLPSGRYRALYYADGKRQKAPTTFRTKGDARQFLATVQADLVRGTWLPPVEKESATFFTLAEYAEQWLPNRLVGGKPLKDKTRQHYRRLLDHHILPALGDMPLSDITADDVRAWHAELLTDRPTMRAHAYGLLRTILSTAVADSKITVNPCTIRGAGTSRRQVVIKPASVGELEKLVNAMPEQYRMLVLLAAWCALRFGELTELRRKDIDVENAVISVTRAVVRVTEGRTSYIVTTPKSDAGIRDVAIPPHILPALRDHLVDHVVPGENALLFPATGGGHLAPQTMERWYHAARDAAGRPDLRFHDLRHTGAVLASLTGATLAELMGRLGHSTVGAALRYQHVAQGRDQQIAAKLSELVGDTP